ncbi:MAG TPA: S41 family peptidase [Roseiflexaceae bacterium]|nr:S41 family peptidase [Roseiflexaceae bacterium]
MALNGGPIADWLARLGAHVSADNDYMLHTLLENRFAALLWLELGPVEQFALTVRDVRGAIREVSVPARTREEIKAAAAQAPPALELDWDARVFLMAGRVGYLRPGPFYNNDPNATNIWDTSKFRAFVDGAFHTLATSKATALVIDLRDNPGGDNSFSDLLVAWYASKPFRFCREFRIKVSEAAIASNAKRVALAPNDNDGISAKLAAAYGKHRAGDVFAFDITMVDPRPGVRFAGKVYLLINRHSYSNAVQVAALSQDYGFATIVGEETSDLATTIGAMEQFTLSRTGIAVGFPKAEIVRVNGDRRPRGVVPDIAIDTPVVESPSDVVLQQALAIAGRS